MWYNDKIYKIFMKLKGVSTFDEGLESQGLLVKKLGVGQKVFKFLEKTKFLDIRKSDEKFEDWLQEISYKDFSNYLMQLNGILRGVPIKERLVDGKNVEVSLIMGFTNESISSYLPPVEKEKENFMREIFAALKDISDNEDRALLAYYALQAIHLFSDGNGRVGRLLYELISADGKNLTEDKLSELLDHNKTGHDGIGKGREIFSEKVLNPSRAYYLFNREVAKVVLGNEFFREYGKIYYSGSISNSSLPDNFELSSEERMLGGKMFGERDVANFGFFQLAITKLLQENGKLANCQYALVRPTNRNEVVFEDVGKKIMGIDDEIFFAEFTAEDVRRLIEIHKEIKSSFIRMIIDVFLNPHRHQLKEDDGKEVPIKSVFRKKLGYLKFLYR